MGIEQMSKEALVAEVRRLRRYKRNARVAYRNLQRAYSQAKTIRLEIDAETVAALERRFADNGASGEALSSGELASGRGA